MGKGLSINGFLACKYRIIFVGLNTFIKKSMKPLNALKRLNTILLFFLLTILLTGVSSCGLMHSMFGPKYGCPSNGKNVGAERILSGEKVPKAGKFKA
jgi:hypothetical protein